MESAISKLARRCKATDAEVIEAMSYETVVQEVERQIKFLRELKEGGKRICK